MKLIYLTSKNYPASTADHIYIAALSRAFTKILGNNFSLIIANSFGDDLNGINYSNLNLSLKRLRTLYYFFWLPYFLLKGNSNTRDIVFFSNDPNLLLVLIFWKKVLFLRYKICSDWHMLFGDWRDGFIAKRSGCLISTSEKLKNYLVSISGINAGKIPVVYGGIDLEDYEYFDKNEARKKLDLPLSAKIVTYAGFFKTLGMDKGIGTMIKALPELSDGVIMLFVGGKDNEIAEYKEMAMKLNVLSRVIFIGRKTTKELTLYEQASDILAIPYPNKPHFRDFGFPMKVYEYMASKRPIIYSKLDLVEEVIGDCAYFFTPDDSKSFAEAIKKIIGDDKEASENASRAYEKVKKYTWNRKADIILRNV